MTTEMATVIIILLAMFALACEYLWLYVVAQSQEEYLRTQKRCHKEIKGLFVSSLGSPVKDTREKEIKAISEYIDNDTNKYYIALRIYQKFLTSKELSNERKNILEEIYTELNPNEKLPEMLNSSNSNEKAYIIRNMAALGIADKLDDLRQYLYSRNKKLVYHTGMALSILGDEDGTIEFITICGNEKRLSSRVIMEIIDCYTGDRVELIKRFYDDVDDYLKATVIKGVIPYELSGLSDIYHEGAKSKSDQVRIASIKAIAQFGNISDEHTLITAMNDRNWIVRLSAIGGLQKIRTQNSLEAIVKAINDDEWWIRQNAADALVKIDPNFENVENVIKGYDRYASDAVKSSLSKEIS